MSILTYGKIHICKDVLYEVKYSSNLKYNKRLKEIVRNILLTKKEEATEKRRGILTYGEDLYFCQYRSENALFNL